MLNNLLKNIGIWLVIGLVVLTALLLLAISDWRLSILIIAIQYTGVFALVATHWPAPMAITRPQVPS